MVIHNRTVFEIPLTWNRIRFEATRNQYRVARKLIETSINVQFDKQLKGVFSHNIEIEENINEINQHLFKCHDKLRVLDNMIELASQSLRIYFDNRMASIRTIIKEHCDAIQEIIHEEADHWKEIHAVLDQHLLNPGDIRSRNNFPQTVQKSPAPNIQTIEEEEDNEEPMSKLLNGKTLTPLLTQMIRKSRIQSKRLTLVPSNKARISLEQENSIPRKHDQFSMHIIPLSTTRQPLDIVDTTFVIKPEDTMVYGGDDDEPNGTYRAPSQYQSYLSVPQRRETLLADSQPNIPARLCFSPTILQENDDEQSSSSSEIENNDERFKTIVVTIDQNRTHIKKPLDDIHRFGQTFLLDIVKTEQMNDEQNIYIRPRIQDDDVLVVNNTNTSEKIHNDPIPPRSTSQENATVQETVKPKSRSRVPVQKKSQPTIVSARKTRSATKIIAEQQQQQQQQTTVIEQISSSKSTETKRKTRKRKQSKSVDRLVDTSDEENPPSTSTQTTTRRKTKRRRKSKTERRSSSISEEDNQSSSRTKHRTVKRSKSRRNDRQQDVTDDNEKKNKKMTKKIRVQELSQNENDDKRIHSSKRKKSKVTTNDDEDKSTKAKKRKPKTKKSKKEEDEEQTSKPSTSTRSTSKRNRRAN